MKRSLVLLLSLVMLLSIFGCKRVLPEDEAFIDEDVVMSETAGGARQSDQQETAEENTTDKQENGATTPQEPVKEDKIIINVENSEVEEPAEQNEPKEEPEKPEVEEPAEKTELKEEAEKPEVEEPAEKTELKEEAEKPEVEVPAEQTEPKEEAEKPEAEKPTEKTESKEETAKPEVKEEPAEQNEPKEEPEKPEAEEPAEQTEPKEEAVKPETNDEEEKTEKEDASEENTADKQDTQVHTPPSQPENKDGTTEEEEVSKYIKEAYTKLSEEQLAGLTSLKKESTGKQVYRFDYELFSNLKWEVNPLVYYFTPPEPTYSSLMNSIGSDGIIVAGYATGLRESHSFTIEEEGGVYTQFVVTDLYYGTETAETITIKEPYTLKIEEGYGQIYYRTDLDRKAPKLKNNIKVLLYLKKSAEKDYYISCYSPIPLQDDYRDYSEEYLNSMLDFFRGDKSEYKEIKIVESADEPEVIVNPDGTIELAPIPEPEDPSFREKNYYWPERDISNEALIEEMSDHILVQTAVNYKVAIWPCRHKNYNVKGDFSKFVSICVPAKQS